MAVNLGGGNFVDPYQQFGPTASAMQARDSAVTRQRDNAVAILTNLKQEATERNISMSHMAEMQPEAMRYAMTVLSGGNQDQGQAMFDQVRSTAPTEEQETNWRNVRKVGQSRDLPDFNPQETQTMITPGRTEQRTVEPAPAGPMPTNVMDALRDSAPTQGTQVGDMTIPMGQNAANGNAPNPTWGYNAPPAQAQGIEALTGGYSPQVGQDQNTPLFQQILNSGATTLPATENNIPQMAQGLNVSPVERDALVDTATRQTNQNLTGLNPLSASGLQGIDSNDEYPMQDGQRAVLESQYRPEFGTRGDTFIKDGSRYVMYTPGGEQAAPDVTPVTPTPAPAPTPTPSGERMAPPAVPTRRQITENVEIPPEFQTEIVDTGFFATMDNWGKQLAETSPAMARYLPTSSFYIDQALNVDPETRSEIMKNIAQAELYTQQGLHEEAIRLGLEAALPYVESREQAEIETMIADGNLAGASAALKGVEAQQNAQNLALDLANPQYEYNAEQQQVVDTINTLIEGAMELSPRETNTYWRVNAPVLEALQEQANTVGLVIGTATPDALLARNRAERPTGVGRIAGQGASTSGYTEEDVAANTQARIDQMRGDDG